MMFLLDVFNEDIMVEFNEDDMINFCERFGELGTKKTVPRLQISPIRYLPTVPVLQ
jgi:hypothetical protein